MIKRKIQLTRLKRSITTLAKQETWKESEVEALVSAVEQTNGSSEPENYARIFTACIKIKSLQLGRRVHNHILRTGFQPGLFLGNQIVYMYSKCGSLSDARSAFNQLRQRNVFSWTALLTAVAENGHCKEAVKLFRLMHLDGVRADKVLLVILLQSCAASQDLKSGLLIHEFAKESGLISETIVSNSLINMFSKCRCPGLALDTFNVMHEPTIVSWTSVIEAQALNGLGQRAVHLFRMMQLHGETPNEVTFAVAIEACDSPAFLNDGRVLHRLASESGFDSQLIVGTVLVRMYVLCKCLHEAVSVFESLDECSVVSWSVMIQAFGEQGMEQEMFHLYQSMLLDGVRPDSVTFLPLLNSCNAPQKLEVGRTLHQQLASAGLDDSNAKNCLVTMYGLCGDLQSAGAVFALMEKQDEISWNAMFGAYGENGEVNRAYAVYCEMLLSGVKPSRVSFLTVLSLCGTLQGATESVHRTVAEAGVEDNPGVQTALLSAYVKCNRLDKAELVFERMHEWNAPSCNALMGGFTQLGLFDRSLMLLRQMLLCGVKLTEVTLVTALDSCSSASAIEHGKFIHSLLKETPVLSTVSVRNSLLNMYSSCGKPNEACEVFLTGQLPDVVAWTNLIESYAWHGQGGQALVNFYRMQQDGFSPNSVSFKTILSACSHSGLVNEGIQVFECLVMEQQQRGTEISSFHVGCVVDLLGRAGETELAEKLVRRLANDDDEQRMMRVGKVELVLLGACRSHGDVERGERVGAGAVEKLEKNANAQGVGYLLLSHLYAGSGSSNTTAKEFRFDKENQN